HECRGMLDARPSIMQRTSSFPMLLFSLVVLAGIAIAYGVYGTFGVPGSAAILTVAVLIASFVARALRVASAWDRAVVLRLGKFRALRGPGLFGMIPIVDT